MLKAVRSSISSNYIVALFLCFPAAILMHKYGAHAATDVTGFGILGHAQNLARFQKKDVSFVIHNLPVISKMQAIDGACNNRFKLKLGYSPETSGMYYSCCLSLF